MFFSFKDTIVYFHYWYPVSSKCYTFRLKFFMEIEAPETLSNGFI